MCDDAHARSIESGKWELCAKCGWQVIAPAPLPSPPRDIPAELRGLARWLSTLLGRAAGIEPTTRGGLRDGRPDYIDEHHDDLAKASIVLRRLEAMYAHTDDDQFAATVLWAKHVRGQLDDETVGLLFAERRTRRGWLKSEKHGIRHTIPRTQGKVLVAQAEQCFRDAPLVTVANPGWLNALTQDLDRRAYEMREDMADVENSKRRAYQARVLARRQVRIAR